MVSVAKDHATQCQGGEGSTEFNEDLTTPVNERERLLKNTANKHIKLCWLLCTYQLDPNSNMVSTDEAKVTHE